MSTLAHAPSPASRTAFRWNASAWFGTQVGSTLWMLPLALLLFPRDAAVAGAVLAGFLLLNGWGLVLWRAREHRTAHAGFQLFLAAAAVSFALVVFLVNARGLSTAPNGGELTSTWVPWWVLAVAPAMMLVFYARERAARRAS
ncbi:MAG: hypothetical protein IPJ77_20710 [Planctomycetes bacterium]|nr:hypothetical protein [Planctomycetota bacterium]